MNNPFKDSEDKLLFAKVLDKLAASEKKRQPSFTDFLDPMRCGAFIAALGSADVTTHGGHENAEREMIGFGAGSPADFPITPVAVRYNQKFSKAPTHRDYLGATLGLGIDRGKVGDILLAAEGATLYVASDIASYVAEGLTQVGRVTVKATAGSTLETTGNTIKEKRVTVSSLRLDAVVSAALNISRGKSAALIDAEKVFVNWKPGKKTQTLSPGDKITVRGVGRITINTEDGRTKKDRIVITVGSTGP
ncbi:MAG: YlmH/Sll1252 family protein [Defluviitaleaceae bacterium]|nr:YlmH/Sll1252 family protein [Defluviitaleaceae bacterium]